jgi:hypothetical protein
MNRRPSGNERSMEETPICSAVERDLGICVDEITGPRPEWAPEAGSQTA